jgi:nucleoside-diphosphate-sugar epimerase
MSELHLVTGGSGYFGLLLIERLKREGHRARIFDINDAEDRPAEVEFIRGDIRDADAVRRACEGADVVHHNVALVPLAKDKDAFWSVNRDGTRVLLDACREAGVRKVMHTSSSAVFGVPERNPVDESMTPHPREDYGRAKLAAEQLCHEAPGTVSMSRSSGPGPSWATGGLASCRSSSNGCASDGTSRSSAAGRTSISSFMRTTSRGP